MFMLGPKSNIMIAYGKIAYYNFDPIDTIHITLLYHYIRYVEIYSGHWDGSKTWVSKWEQGNTNIHSKWLNKSICVGGVNQFGSNTCHHNNICDHILDDLQSLRLKNIMIFAMLCVYGFEWMHINTLCAVNVCYPYIILQKTVSRGHKLSKIDTIEMTTWRII